MPSSSVVIVSKQSVYPQHNSAIKSLKLSVSDLPMLSCQYIQKGVLLPTPILHSSASLISLFKLSLSKTLSHFSALAGRLGTDDATGHVYILCNDAGVDLYHAKASHFSTAALIPPSDQDIPAAYRRFFQLDVTLSYAGHHKPLVTVQITELADAVFVGCTMNHAVVDGTSFWNFFNTFAEIARGESKISKAPDFCRDTVFDSPAVLAFPPGGPSVTFSGDQPLREKIFHISREAILRLKSRANNNNNNPMEKPQISMSNRSNDNWAVTNGANNRKRNGKITSVKPPTAEISSFQSLCAQLWRSVTRARKLPHTKTTTFRMAVNCRHRLEPRLAPLYFGNAIQSIPTVATSGDLLANHLSWGADQLHDNVVAHGAAGREGLGEQSQAVPAGEFRRCDDHHGKLP